MQTHEFIRCRYGVQIALLSIVKVRVRLPDPCQHAYAECERVLGTLEGQAAVHPRLPEVTIHRVRLCGECRSRKEIINLSACRLQWMVRHK